MFTTSASNSLAFLDLMNQTNANLNQTYTLPRRNIQKIVLYSILFVISSLGNTTSFIALCFMNKKKTRVEFKNPKSRIRLLLLNLCVADLLTAYVILPFEISWAVINEWLAGRFVCKLMMFIRGFGMYLPSFIIIAITIDHYYVIVRPLDLERVYWLNKKLIAVSWIMAVISSLPQLYVFDVLAHPR